MTALATRPTRPIVELAHPTRQAIAAHLLEHHTNTGLGLDTIARYSGDELLAFHEVDHRHCATSWLGHFHTATPPPAPAPSSDDAIHRAMLKAIDKGSPVPNLDDILARAARASARAAARRHDDEGRRIPGAGVDLSPAERRDLEIAQAVATRAARRARRTTRGPRRG